MNHRQRERLITADVAAITLVWLGTSILTITAIRSVVAGEPVALYVAGLAVIIVISAWSTTRSIRYITQAKRYANHMAAMDERMAERAQELDEARDRIQRWMERRGITATEEE